MVNCLHKLRYPVRAPGADESVEQYKDYLVEEFKKRNLDPEKYGKSDIKRYEIRKELEELQKASGVPMDLDKRQRVGRGLAGISLQKDTPTTKDDDWFLDN
ncbi:hypothetical protein AGDE_14814 [Angomonas deanei]|nr:hypothetical protein AGDE_14814 [Angomonas deanei]|eukprot:EPY20167.1 hypothetical protein AGDE_14814 [Angomonas deanei]